MSSIEKIFAEIAQYTKTMSSLHGDYLNIVRNDINRFLELTSDTVGQMNGKGWRDLGIHGLGASLGILSACIPKTPSTQTNPLNPRLNANGVSDMLSKGLQDVVAKLKDNEFLSSTTKTVGLFFSDGLSRVTDSWHQAKMAPLHAKKELIERINLQEGQSKKSMFDQEIQKAHQAVLNLIQSRSRAG